MSIAKLSGASLLAASLWGMSLVHAAPVTFTGVDANADSGDPRPLANAAAANFDTAAGALGTIAIITFETAPVGPFASLSVAPGVTISGLGAEIADGPLFSPPPPPANATGYNTTSGGKQFVQTSFSETGATGPITFTFTTPIEAFGAYITGVQADGENMTFDDGTAQTVHIPNPSSANGGVEFVGFTDGGKTFSSVTINVLNSLGTDDEVGIDDVRFVVPTTSGCPPGTSGPNCSPNNAPEPASLTLLAAAFAGLSLARRRKVR